MNHPHSHQAPFQKGDLVTPVDATVVGAEFGRVYTVESIDQFPHWIPGAVPCSECRESNQWRVTIQGIDLLKYLKEVYPEYIPAEDADAELAYCACAWRKIGPEDFERFAVNIKTRNILSHIADKKLAKEGV